MGCATWWIFSDSWTRGRTGPFHDHHAYSAKCKIWRLATHGAHVKVAQPTPRKFQGGSRWPDAKNSTKNWHRIQPHCCIICKWQCFSGHMPHHTQVSRHDPANLVPPPNHPPDAVAEQEPRPWPPKAHSSAMVGWSADNGDRQPRHTTTLKREREREEAAKSNQDTNRKNAPATLYDHPRTRTTQHMPKRPPKTHTSTNKTHLYLSEKNKPKTFSSPGKQHQDTT